MRQYLDSETPYFDLSKFMPKEKVDLIFGLIEDCERKTVCECYPEHCNKMEEHGICWCDPEQVEVKDGDQIGLMILHNYEV